MVHLPRSLLNIRLFHPLLLREKVPSISSDVEQVVLKALEKDPHNRFETVQAFAWALSVASKQEPSLPPTIQAIPPTVQAIPPTVQAVSREKLYPPAAPNISRKSIEQWFNEGNTHFDAGRYPNAIVSYTRALELDPKYTSAYFNRGNAYYTLKQYEAAIVDYTHALKLNPKYAIAYFNRGNAYKLLKEYHKAIADYEHTLELYPDHGSARSARKEALRLLKKQL